MAWRLTSRSRPLAHARCTRSPTGTARVVIASARALLPRLSDPARLKSSGIAIAPGLEIAPHELGERLVLAGFAPEDPVDEHGEFCVRGGVVDFYPTAEAQPVRLEFIGDIVESVRRYDAATQRSLAGLDQIHVSPQRELLPVEGIDDDPDAIDRSASVADYVRLAGATLLVVEIDDVADRGRKLEEQWRASEADMRQRGRSVPEYQQLALGWQDLEPWIAGGRRLSELAVEDEGSSRERSHVVVAAVSGVPRPDCGLGRGDSRRPDARR